MATMKSQSGRITIGVYCAFGAACLPIAEGEIFKAFIASVRRIYSAEARVVLLTDEMLDFRRYEELVDEIHARPTTRQELLLDRARAYQEFVESHDWRTPVAFLDYDVLLLRRLDEVFAFEEDIFLTRRKYFASMPINGGVLMLNNRRPNQCKSFYSAVLREYTQLPVDQLNWWGD
jgi:hypothetical protein